MNQIEWVMWKCQLKPTTCNDCRSRHGQFYNKAKLTVKPPLHPNCTCVLIPVKSVSQTNEATNISSALKDISSAMKDISPALTDISSALTNATSSLIDATKAINNPWRHFAGGTPSLVKTAIEAAFRASNLVLRRHLAFSPKKNYEHNSKISFEGYIHNQDNPPASEVRMGVALFESNACGWVAAYNAFLSMGIYIHPADIVNYIETTPNGLIANGAFGTNPFVFDKIFKTLGMETTTTLFKDALDMVPGISAKTRLILQLPTAPAVDLDKLAKQGRTVIITYFNDKTNIGKGAHYVNITWNEKTGVYEAYNTTNQNIAWDGKEGRYIELKDDNEPGFEIFDSIIGFLNKENRALISITVIH